jgi:hypothetical protein
MQHASTTPSGGAVPDAVLIELQGALGFLHDQAAAAVRRLYDYVERHGPEHPGLDGALAAAIEASHAFQAADYGRALDEVRRAYRAVAEARAVDPSLPPLSGLAGAAEAR